MIPNTAAHNNSMSPVILPCVVTTFNTHCTTIDINTIPKTTLIKIVSSHVNGIFS